MGIEHPGKVAIVTGGARGIGKGMATALLKSGASVTVTDILEDTLAEAGEFYESIAPGRHLEVVADGTRDDHVNAAVQQTVDAFGGIDMLINNAQGSVTGKNLEEQTVDEVMVAMDSGFFASFRYMKACYPYIKERQGTVVNFGSQAGPSATGAWSATTPRRRRTAPSPAPRRASGRRTTSRSTASSRAC
jgi:NAD(P)-dependent dehydrogenase (short-subunit alcohol dehydrogenase family)